MTRVVPSIIDEAIDWHLRADAMAPASWCDFVAWLEADPAHARAYDAVALQDRTIADASFPMPLAANDDAPLPRRWLRIVGGTAVAAALAAWLVPMAQLSRPSAEQVFATRDGERRDIRLDDGTEIAMNGGTMLRVAAGGTRDVSLDRGEATLHVVHDAAHPFTLHAGADAIRDLGTTFNVMRAGQTLSVAVAEGSVLFQPGGARLTLAAGDAVTMTGADRRIVRSSVASTAVGGWRSGTLTFEGAPVSEVAASLRRLHGIHIAINGDLSRRPFTGMIHVTGAADRDVPHLADLIGATWRRDGDGWILAERIDTAP